MDSQPTPPLSPGPDDFATQPPAGPPAAAEAWKRRKWANPRTLDEAVPLAVLTGEAPSGDVAPGEATAPMSNEEVREAAFHGVRWFGLSTGVVQIVNLGAAVV